MQMEHNGLAPGQGPVAVTGATGGVGMLAIDMLARRGYEVVAFSRKDRCDALLQQLGAREVRRVDAGTAGTRPLETEQWAGAIDNIGGTVLSHLIRSTRLQGSVAAVGLAGGADLAVSLMPFLLRGVNLLGVNSSATTREMRLKIWARIAGDLRPRHLDAIVSRTVNLAELPGAFAALLDGTHVGRTLVRMHHDVR
jgi:putative YhdH/YhfP family quinone oxidoreductase